MRFDDCGEILPRFAAVDNDGELDFTRDLKLANQNLFLGFPRRMVLVIVEPQFAHCDQLGVLRHNAQVLKMALFGPFRFMGMNANRREDPIVLLRDWHCRSQIVWAATSAHRQEILHPRRAGALDHCVAIGVKLGIVQMSVGVEQELIHWVIG